MKRTWLAAVFGVSILALGTPASAQFGRPDYTYPSYGDSRAPYSQVRRVAYENGYHEGAKHGERDARQGHFGYEHERTFRNADKGYHREFGDRELYRQSFRAGYAEGYRLAFDRSGRYSYGGRPNVGQGRYQHPDRSGYGNGYGYNGAVQNGVNDGYEKGIEDARKNRSFDPLRHKWYREGDRHYDRRYGSREQYENLYRNGFRRGYEQGYRQARW